MGENEPTLLGMELYGNVTVNVKLLPAEKNHAEDYLRERVLHYTERGYKIPDNKILVMRFPDRVDYPLQSGFDGYRFIEQCTKAWPSLMVHAGLSVPFEGKLQNAAYCLLSGKEPTFANMMNLHFTPEFKEFHARQQTDIGPFHENFSDRIATHQRPDDWSFIFGMTDRSFTPEERTDILALGCILSCGMEKYLHTRAQFNAFDRMSVSHAFIREVNEGNVMSQGDFKAESRSLKEKADEILTELYPQVAQVMKDLSGMPTGIPGNESFVLLREEGFLYKGNNKHSQMGFMDFMESYCKPEALPADANDIHNYYFVRCRQREPFDHPGSKGMDEVGYLDACYCISNGRNPLHPANMHHNLVMEKEYAKFIQQAGNRIADRKLRPITKKVDAHTPAARLIAKPKKRGPSL